MSPGLVAPLVLIAGAALLAAGARKIASPVPFAQVLSDAWRMPAALPLARVFGAVEVAVGAGLVLLGHSWAQVFGAALYFALTGGLCWLILRAPSVRSCGCFGASSAPPSWLHVGITGSAALFCLAAALSDTPPALRWVPDLGWTAVPALFGCALCMLLAYLIIDLLSPRAITVGLKDPGGTG